MKEDKKEPTEYDKGYLAAQHEGSVQYAKDMERFFKTHISKKELREVIDNLNVSTAVLNLSQLEQVKSDLKDKLGI